MASVIIQLHHLRFFANHGVFEEEKIVGNEFEVNLWLKIKASRERISSLEQTINYAEVYRLVKVVISKPEPLLEALAMDIAQELQQSFPSIKKLSVQIIKLHPPISSFSGSVSVTFQKRYG